MKYLKLLFFILSSVFLSYCSDNIDEQLTNHTQSSEQNYIIEADFLKNEKLSENEAKFVAETFTSRNLYSTLVSATRVANKVVIDNILPLLSDNNQTLAYAANFKGGGYSTWVIIPSNTPMDFNGFNNNIKLLTIEKI